MGFGRLPLTSLAETTQPGEPKKTLAQFIRPAHQHLVRRQPPMVCIVGLRLRKNLVRYGPWLGTECA